MRFESSVNSYDSQTACCHCGTVTQFESSVNSYDSQTRFTLSHNVLKFESSVNSYDSQTVSLVAPVPACLRVV